MILSLTSYHVNILIDKKKSRLVNNIFVTNKWCLRTVSVGAIFAIDHVKLDRTHYLLYNVIISWAVNSQLSYNQLLSRNSCEMGILKRDMRYTSFNEMNCEMIWIVRYYGDILIVCCGGKAGRKVLAGTYREESPAGEDWQRACRHDITPGHCSHFGGMSTGTIKQMAEMLMLVILSLNMILSTTAGQDIVSTERSVTTTAGRARLWRRYLQSSDLCLQSTRQRASTSTAAPQPWVSRGQWEWRVRRLTWVKTREDTRQ